MAGSLEDNAALYKKKTFAYVPPTPPAELIESTNYTLDFTNRKFVHIGIDPTENFQVAIHLLTSSRHVNISPDFLRRIFSLMGNILSFVLEQPEKYKRMVFLETEFYKISSMIYSGENVLVIESKTENGCRVLLNRADLIQLQYLESSIFEAIVRKEIYTAPLVIEQADTFVTYLRNKFDLLQSPPKNREEMIIFVKNAQDNRTEKACPNLVDQIQMFAAKQLAEALLNRVTQELFTESEVRLISPVSPPRYSAMPPMLSHDEDFLQSLVVDEENANFFTKINPTQATWAPTRRTKSLPSRLPSTSPTSLAVDENDGPTFFNHSPSILDFSNGKPTKKLNNQNAKRKLFLNDIV